jgi:hypothetical protein
MTIEWGGTACLADDILVEDPQGLESEQERLMLGFGGYMTSSDPVIDLHESALEHDSHRRRKKSAGSQVEE